MRVVLKYERFVYETRRNTLILSVSCRSVMNSARELVFAQFTRKSGIVWRITLPTTNSDGGMPGRMVLSQEPNESQTSLGNTTERYCSMALRDGTSLHEDMISMDFAADLFSVAIRLAMKVLVPVPVSQRGHVHHPEMVGE